MRTPELVIVAAGVLFVTVSWTSIAAIERSDGDPVAPRLIAALNEQIQERFKDTDKGFGITRMAPFELGELDESGRVRVRRHRIATRLRSQNPLRFRAETLEEAAVLRDLDGAGLGVLLYLGSRDGTVKGPVVLTEAAPREGESAPPALPDASVLLDGNRAAMETFAGDKTHEFVAADWKFIAMPVCASSQQCVECHGVPLGSLVGVALYGYR